MVETQLVVKDIDVGERAVKALDDERADVRSAFWLYYPDAGEYRLVLALPVVDKEGPETGYKLVQRALLKHHVPLAVRRVVVVGPKEPLAKALHNALGDVVDTDDETIRARLGGRVIDGLSIDDAYAYRSK